MDWPNKEIFAGDSQGGLYIYDLVTGETKSHLQLSGFKIKEISLSNNFIGLAFSNGSCIIAQRQRSLDSQVKLEDGVLELANKQKMCIGNLS